MKMLIIIFAMLISLPAMAAKPSGSSEASPPLLAVFTDTDPSDCTFRHLTADNEFGGQATGIDPPYRIYLLIPGRETITMKWVSVPEDVNPLVLEYFVRITGLPLTPDDFRDPTTGEFDCTNDKLFSLL